MSLLTATGFFRSAWLCTVLIQNTIDEYLEFRQLKKNAGTKMPHEVKGLVDEETFVKSQKYNYDKRLFGMLVSFLEMLFDIWVTLRVTGALFVWTGTVVSPENEYMRTILWFIVGSWMNNVIAIPIAAYRTFVIEQRHGFNRMTAKLFITDLVKSEIISMVFVFLLVPPVIYLIRWGGEYFYVYVWVFAQVVVVVMMFVYPAIIQPLFNKYEPLHDMQLREKIEALAASHHFPLTKLFQVLWWTFEFQADRFSVDDGRSGDLKTALTKLQKDNLGDMDPDRLYAWVKYTHPAIVERLRGIEDAQALYEKRGGKPAAIFETSKDKEDGVLVEKEDVPADAGLRERK
ncbi:caax prenyl protease ste24, putative [Perkinsus marinus ATCC 50983]|uniref:Caax prenyl protease ste24, putative n=1 Tax=Perkinsus marinus (strain ATCC 50983 / TXsc) TaxID=423536 RepID=C5L704_PERM5|nr:caax prenyl protease ste24, putative [Perkinsus marinus ATCC 50983]EER07266.1 caax prenyl protease ste24, putative [Perkinsus marinus ATCC 50983]|eukprot:XP_002775450.1 caax prenyl protease ste24, putative [Perkinsus marinus ATCC 50983]